MSEEINFDDVEFGEPIEEKEPSYRDGYIRGIYRARNIIDSKQKEIERLNKELETLKQPQVFIDTQDMEERYAQGIYEDFIEEEYEKLIFDYLTNNCKEFDDEHIKKLVDLKVKQHLSSQKEIERLNNIINELEKYVIDREERSWDDNGAYDDVLDKLQELKGSDE